MSQVVCSAIVGHADIQYAAKHICSIKVKPWLKKAIKYFPSTVEKDIMTSATNCTAPFTVCFLNTLTQYEREIKIELIIKFLLIFKSHTM